jgi:tetraacyldisaccharide 4'-kinase
VRFGSVSVWHREYRTEAEVTRRGRSFDSPCRIWSYAFTTCRDVSLRPPSDTRDNAKLTHYLRFPVECYHAVIRGERRGPLAILARASLRLASMPYRLGVWWRNRQYDRSRRAVHRAGVPVISVGNLSLGGTGKTPCVEYVARFYRERGFQVAVLSRGYGSDAGPNDEAMVLEENLPDVPHLQGADRVLLAGAAVEELEAELLVLDDGFQHRRMHRDLDIVLIDATSPPHRDRLFPRGTLREPASSLKRAGAVLLTRCDQVEPGEVTAIRMWIADRFPNLRVATTEHRPTIESGSLQGRTVGAFCGIGNPAAFRRTLEGLGAGVIEFRTFPDHHAYTREDVGDLREWANRLPADAEVATTQKDGVKLRLADLSGRPLRIVRIEMKFREGQEAFDELLQTIGDRDVRGPG